MAQPDISLNVRGVKIAGWKNTGKNGDYFSFKVSKSYKDKATDQWRDDGSFFPEDLLILSQLAQQAWAESNEKARQHSAVTSSNERPF